jgi:hypothetical protein
MMETYQVVAAVTAAVVLVLYVMRRRTRLSKED